MAQISSLCVFKGIIYFPYAFSSSFSSIISSELMHTSLSCYKAIQIGNLGILFSYRGF